jgi:uronate dehydrogenase
VRIGLEHPDIRLRDRIRGLDNRRSWYGNSNAERLGYRPLDDSEPYAEAVLAAEPGGTDPIGEHYHGAVEYNAETRRE